MTSSSRESPTCPAASGAGLQFLRILLDEPNVLLLDEPTNDLDIDTLTVIEDYLDDWPGTLIVVTHDRYFLERVTDVTYALTGGGRCRPAARRHRAVSRRTRSVRTRAEPPGAAAHGIGVGTRATHRQGDGPHRRATRQAGRTDRRDARRRWQTPRPITSGLANSTAELNEMLARKDSLEEAWLSAADE